jgi:hypothetical protein
MPDKIKKQAVVVIHGMGEQRPMDTLRSFVDSVKTHLSKTDNSEINTTVRSKPDWISGTFETRKLSLSSSRNRPRTDFYEFYWAHNMRDTKFTHTFTWIFKLIFSRYKKVPQRLRSLWLTIWAIIVAIPVILIATGVDDIKIVISVFAGIPLLTFVISLLEKFAGNLFLSTLGDAARYFTPVPSNIEQRNNIRQQGIAFLKKLHEQNEGNGYDRVVVVAHSLGSAVAYDLLRFIWNDYYFTFEKKEEVNQHYVKELDAYSTNWPTGKTTDDYQEIQYLAWLQQRQTGNKWLISDFITLGAAICYADYFLVTKQSFEQLKKEREFPVCPPVPDDKDNSISYLDTSYDVVVNGKTEPRTILRLSHSSMFGITRWTNIFFSSDFIGGKGSRIFGSGVKDCEIPRSSIWLLPGGHTNYWDKESEASLDAIVKALRLRTDENPSLPQKEEKATV